VDEYPLPPGANITQVHIIHRHGARYPTLNDGPEQFGKRLAKLVADGVRFEGELSFLNDWNYELGDEMLVARGRQELFDSGILHWYNYGRLHDPSTKIVARTTTQYRMLQSAENFMAGFFGFDWRDNVTIEAVIEANGFNGSASAYNNCPNSSKRLSYTADEAVDRWKRVYLADATRRFQQLVRGNYTWTVDDSYNMQQLCPYETVALGFSRFCQLFTYDEWKGLEYSDDMQWYGDFSFGSPTARAVGIGQVVETLARMEGHVVDAPAGTAGSLNMTLDGDERTFPTNQTLYFDFSHDTQMMAVLTAFGLRQFAQYLPATGPPPNQQLVASHLTPFAARFAIEVIKAPRPVLARRPRHTSSSSQADAHYYYNMSAPAAETRYVHFLVNQRTVPLGRSFPDCGDRDDGWCEFDTFIRWQRSNVERARFEYSCFGNYSEVPYGVVMDGVPVN